MTLKHMKRCSTALVREIQIKIILSHSSDCTRSNYLEHRVLIKEAASSYTAGADVDGYKLSGRQYRMICENYKCTHPLASNSPFRILVT